MHDLKVLKTKEQIILISNFDLIILIFMSRLVTNINIQNILSDKYHGPIFGTKFAIIIFAKNIMSSESETCQHAKPARQLHG